MLDKRAAQLRQQAPLVALQLAELHLEREELEAAVRATPAAAALAASIIDADAGGGGGGAGGAGGGGGVADYRALLRQAHAVNEALKARLQAERGARAAGGEASVIGRPHGLVPDGAARVPLSFFADGLMLYRGPFRPYGGADADSFAAQLMGGHAPHELACAHPRGFCFELHDHCGTPYADAAAAAARGGGGGGGARVAGLDAL
eukprot:3015213-Prymnesium_polylepis.1